MDEVFLFPLIPTQSCAEFNSEQNCRDTFVSRRRGNSQKLFYRRYPQIENETSKTIPLSNIYNFSKLSSYLSTKHIKLTSLHLSSSPYQKIFSFSPPSIQNPLSQTPSGKL